MANSAGVCNNFKWQTLTGIHAFGPGTGAVVAASETRFLVNQSAFTASQ